MKTRVCSSYFNWTVKWIRIQVVSYHTKDYSYKNVDIKFNMHDVFCFWNNPNQVRSKPKDWKAKKKKKVLEAYNYFNLRMHIDQDVVVDYQLRRRLGHKMSLDWFSNIHFVVEIVHEIFRLSKHGTWIYYFWGQTLIRMWLIVHYVDHWVIESSYIALI